MAFVNYDSAVKNLQESVLGVHGADEIAPVSILMLMCHAHVNVFVHGACIVVLKLVPMDIIK
jgi:hypothetical protein